MWGTHPILVSEGPGTIPAEEEAHVKGVLVAAVFCLAVGLFIIFYFCNGTTGLSLAYPLSARFDSHRHHYYWRRCSLCRRAHAARLVSC